MAQAAAMIAHIEARNLLPAAAVLQALAPNTKLRLSVAKDYGDAAGAPTCFQGWNRGNSSRGGPQHFLRAAPQWLLAHAACGQQCQPLIACSCSRAAELRNDAAMR